MHTPESLPQLQRLAIARVEHLISQDAEKAVIDIVRQINKPVRDLIRAETALRLSDENVHESMPIKRASIPIKIVAGFPVSVARLIERNPDPTLWRLISLHPELDSIFDGLEKLLAHWKEFEDWPCLPGIAKDGGPILNHALRISDSLRSLTATRDLLKEISEIEEDMLGAYWHGSHIEIYWMAVALFAGAYSLRVEDLTTVTLVHELAHAYTHMGRDIDGLTWRAGGFEHSEPAVTEGLAQYYTAVVTQKIGNRIPLAHRAYQTLLKHQSGPYRAHESWFNSDLNKRAEVIRSALLQARMFGEVTDKTWRTMLEHAQLTIRSGNTERRVLSVRK